MSDAGPLRLFTALDLPEEVRRALARWGGAAQTADDAVRALPAASLHLTLHFLGERPAAELPALREALRRVALDHGPAIELTCGQALWLPHRRPHALACACTATGDGLERLHATLGAALGSAGDWRPAHRPLLAHVTVARVRRGRRPRPGVIPAPPVTAFRATTMSLQRSRLDPGGARYETLERAALGAV